MSWFSPLFQSGTAFYGDPFPPIITTISDWGWSLLPQFPGSIRPSQGSGTYRGEPIPPTVGDVGLPDVPVGQPTDHGVSETGLPPVFAGSSGSGSTPVLRTVVVDTVATEIESHPEGDYPAGSIFAPGEAWGGGDDHGLDSEDPVVAVDWGGVLDWTLDTISGQQPWQVGGFAKPDPNLNYAMFQPPTVVPPPTGIPGQPTTITGYTGGSAVTNGDNCGNRRYVTLDRETGKISCKRRRRRRLLTNRDLADLASLKTITGGGAALNAAVIRAVR